MRIKKTSQYIEGGATLSNTYGTSQTNGYTQEFLNGTILYNNSSGTETTFQISDDAENYRCIEIIFGRDASSTYSRSSVKIFEPHGKRGALLLQLSGTSSVYILVANITISHTTMTIANSREISISNNAYPVLDTDRLISVYKVIGYK